MMTRWTTTVVAGAIASLVFGCAGPAASARDVGPRRQSVRELEERGRGFASVGDFTRAEQYLSAALHEGADSRRVLPLLAHVCVAAGRYRAAGEYLRAHLRENPTDVRLHVLYGLLEAAVGEASVAEREYVAAIRVQPDDPAAHYALAVLFRDNVGDAAGADAEFREYLRVAPTGEHALEARGSLLGEGP